MAQIFTQQDFNDKSERIAHGFFGRGGGVSTGIYQGLNCGIGSNDDPAHVIENRRIVAQALGAEPENLLSLYQIHSATCVKVEQGWQVDERPQADAFVTDKPGLALGILTADCAPVLFAGQKEDGTPVIGAAHAGWGGALGGVLGATVQAMEELGAARENIRACVGPCIGKKSYEVGAEFYERFVTADEESERFFSGARREDHYMFDLPGFCALQLARAGLSNIYLQDRDTYAGEQDFYSYRRKTHRGEPDYGRQISAIVIKT